MNKKNQPGDLSYFRLSLLSFLKESHPQLAQDASFVESRSDDAARIFFEAIKSGSNQIEAMELANETMYQGLHFSRYDVLFDILFEEFSSEVSEEEIKNYALEMLPVCEEVFARYPISDDFEYEPEFETLKTELIGAIAIRLEKNGLQ